jgi:hypothetical protein
MAAALLVGTLASSYSQPYLYLPSNRQPSSPWLKDSF